MDDRPNSEDVTPSPPAPATPRRPMLDPAKPWLEAGRSWSAAADRVEAYDAQQRGGRRRWWHSISAEEAQLRQRAEAARRHARQLDRLTARGWFVWHDRLAPASRNVVDHVLVGPGGVVVLQSIPGYDHEASNGARHTGPVTRVAIDASMEVIVNQILPAIHDTALTFFPEGWDVLVRGHLVLVDKTLRGSFSDVLRPAEVAAYVDRGGAWLAPVDVHALASALDTVMPPAPLEG